MKIHFYIILFTAIIFSACGGNTNRLAGNIYLHEDGAAKQYVGFYPDSVIFKWTDEMGTEVFTTPYKMTQVDDSTYNIEVVNKHKWMENPNWKIILDKDGGFHSADSKKKYILSSAPMIR